jgi:hypothetical protein
MKLEGSSEVSLIILAHSHPTTIEPKKICLALDA